VELHFNIGSALLLSWASITYAQDEVLKHMPILFGSTGRHHFEKAMRSYKKYCLSINTEKFNLETFSASGFIHKISDNIHRNQLKTLISANERCILTFSCQYLWHKAIEKKCFFRKGQQSYITSKATVLFTNKALLIARDGLEASVGNCIDVLNVPLDKVNSFFVSEEKTDQATIYKLKINFTKGLGSEVLDISLMSLDENVGIFINSIHSPARFF